MSEFVNGARVKAPAPRQPTMTYPELLLTFITMAKQEHGKTSAEILRDIPQALRAIDIAAELSPIAGAGKAGV